VTAERDLQPAKQHSPSFSTGEGIEIDERDEQPQNAPPSIRESLEPDSKLTAERDLQYKKQHSPTLSRDGGRQIDERDEQRANAPALPNG
jgi:hypothetical protein